MLLPLWHARLLVALAPGLLAIGGCSPSGELPEVLEPVYSRANCTLCESTPEQLAGVLPPPPPRDRGRAVQRRAAAGEHHALLAEVRSHEGVLAVNVRVELWRHTNTGEVVLECDVQTDRDGVAELPFSGRGTYCVHAVHAEIGAASSSAAQYRLIGSPQQRLIELVLPESEVHVFRAGIVQIGVAGPTGAPLERARVAVWHHEFGTEQPTLAGAGWTDEEGVVRIELERPGRYAVAAKHADQGSGSVEYAWFVPSSSRGDGRTEALAEAPSKADDRDWIACDAHLQLGGVAAEGLAIPFHEFALGEGTELLVTEFPVCCRTWSRTVTQEMSAGEFLRIIASTDFRDPDGVEQDLRGNGFHNVTCLQDEIRSSTLNTHEHTADRDWHSLLLYMDVDDDYDGELTIIDIESQ